MMEERESPISGSPENTESGSPTPISSGVISAAPEATIAAGNGIVSVQSTVSKKRRGRPRKYDADGNLSLAYASRLPKSETATIAVSPPPGFTLTPSMVFPVMEFGSKRGRAKTSPSSNLQQFALGGVFAETAGIDFTPHILTVQTGEDVAAKINSIGQNGQKGPLGVCVLSANGSISSVTIRQPGTSSGLLTYEGRFEILSLSGSFTMTEANGVTSRTGGLSISLAGPDGRVVGGSVAGWLTAANPIQVVVGSFVPYAYKTQKRKLQRESPPAVAIPTTTTINWPTDLTNEQSVPQVSEPGPAEVAPTPAQNDSEPDDSIGNGHNLNVVSPENNLEWHNRSQGSPQQRIYPDINVSLPGI